MNIENQIKAINPESPSLSIEQIEQLIEERAKTFKPFHLYREYFQALNSEGYQYSQQIGKIEAYDIMENTNAWYDITAHNDRREAFHEFTEEPDTMANLIHATKRCLEDVFQAESLWYEYTTIRIVELLNNNQDNIEVLKSIYIPAIQRLQATSYLM